MDTVVIRPATAQDVDRMAEIVNAEPGDEPIALMGDVELARQYGIGLFKLDPIPNDIRVAVVAQEWGISRLLMEKDLAGARA